MGKAVVITGDVEDDHERQGTVDGTAHVLAAVIGSGVLALAWSVAQLGWLLGPAVLLGFAMVTVYTSTLLADCYRFPSRLRSQKPHLHGRRPREVFLCGVAQYANLWGTMVGYTITATASMMAVKRANCFHREGHSAGCRVSGNTFMLSLGLENITWVSVVAAAMSFAYSLIGLCLCAARWVSHGETWNAFQALGNIAFAYTFAEVLIEIQDTLKSPPPEKQDDEEGEHVRDRADRRVLPLGGLHGLRRLRDSAPGNILTGFGFYEPYWLVDIANLCIVLHLAGAYQVFAQPIFAAVEKSVAARWPEAKFVSTVYKVRLPFSTGGRTLSFAAPKVALRTAMVVLTTVVAALVPFFNSVLGLLGASSFWPLSVYFPVTMHIVQAKVRPWTVKWVLLQGLSLVCLLVSLFASVGSVADIVGSLKQSAPFKVQY
ncbi:unnamed protein product [Spirodela intermedia]|uniref:Amino acid transporter transmembrane domain-containing protein n=1 Tax=Spirodela intermedia TaxID=51605 RepID=A0A7I8JFU9_SPIIN|nr:unnamed protein product [Spirodela intermedia]CAA6668282.1 unnamed protein product [Spirodela intermedia]